jgi:hypothetical protein
LVTLFRGFPFAQDTSVVEQVDPLTGAHSVFLTGLNSAVDILPAKEDGTTDHFVLLHASFGPFFSGPGLLLRFSSPAFSKSLVADCLMLPASMALDGKTNTMYVTELTGNIVAVRVAP